jgi:Helix-turn-helix domain of resolvase
MTVPKDEGRPRKREPRPGEGRPTLYKPEYCQRLIDLLSEGLSFAACAGEFSVSRQTIYDWSEEHPEFLDAKSIGEAKTQLWWERRNLAFAKGGEGNATSIVFGLKNRAAADWRDRTEQESTNKTEIVIRGGLPPMASADGSE